MEMREMKQRILEEVDPPSRRKKQRRIIRAVLRTLAEFAVIIAVIFLSFQFIWGMGTVSGQSMYPALHHGDIAFYYRLEKTFEPGDVVVIDRHEEGFFVKRVAAIAGDTVNIQGGRLYVNGREFVTESAAGETLARDGKISYPLQIRDGEVFVIGDNRENSQDSRDFGPVSREDIDGRLLYYFGRVQ